jgi:hypothetical protein
MPSLRHYSGGPPPSAIHGRGRLPRHPCRGAPCAIPAFGLWERGGRSRSKAKAEATARSKDRSLASLDSSYREVRAHEIRPAGRPPRFGFGGARPIERPSGGSAQWATRQGCRVSRPRPWMADGGGPTEQDRSEGTLSLGEGPNERGKSLWLLWVFQSDSL